MAPTLIATSPGGSGNSVLQASDLDCPPRFATPRNLDRPTLGPKCGEIAAALGVPFMPWQQYVADVILEVDPATGLLYYRHWTLLVPRQSGKTTLVVALAVHRALAWGKRQNIVYAAQDRNSALKKWKNEHVVMLEASPLAKVKPKPYRVRLSNGDEAIVWSNGSRHGITANTEKSGHGDTLDLGFVDEAFSQIDHRMDQAFRPAMLTRPDPQMGVLSTAGPSSGKSPYLWERVEAGRERCMVGSHPGTAYFEWSAAPGMDRADEATWWATMPALGHTQPIEAVRSEFETLSPAEFDRAFLNVWNPMAHDTVIPLDVWARQAISQGMDDPVTLAVDVSPDSSSAAIAAASSATNLPGATAGELVDHRPGTGWVVPRLLELRDAQKPARIKLDPKGPAGALLPDLERAGIAVELVTFDEHAQACSALLDGSLNGTFVHTGSPDIDAAVAGACRRVAGDRWLWSRRSSSVDITPLVSLTLAFGGHVRGTSSSILDSIF